MVKARNNNVEIRFHRIANFSLGEKRFQQSNGWASTGPNGKLNQYDIAIC
jgi:hypothetical protein